MESDVKKTETVSASYGGPIEIALNTTLPHTLYNYTVIAEEELGIKEAIAISALTEMRLG